MRVLLIEDDRATAESIQLMLKFESFNVYTADLGEEGLDLGKLYDYDIILLDGAAGAPKRTAELAPASDLIILPIIDIYRRKQALP